MDSPSSKRRRVVAPRSTRAVQVSNTSLDNDGSISPRRATYNAPTRASIAKYNPGLLSGQDNIATRDVRTESATSNLRGPPRGLNPTALRPKMTAPRLSASPTRETSSSPSRRARASHGSLTARASSVRLESDQGDRVANTEAAAATSQIQEQEERSLMEEEKLAESVQRRGKRSRMAQTALLSGLSKDQAEPELPPTPAQLGLETKPRPPAGILSSSPRSKVPGRKAISKNSPLKPRDVPVEALASRDAQKSQDVDQLGHQLSQQAIRDTVEEEDDDTDNDPEVVERRQRLEELSKQLQTLRSDVSFLQSHILQHQEKPDQSISSSNLSRLVNILNSNLTSERVESSPLKPTSLASRLSTFLPFAKRSKPPPEDALLSEEILPAYKPIEGSDPFVHLKAFTSLSVSSLQQLKVIEIEGALLHQQQLRLSASASEDLEIDLILYSDTDTDSIEQLSLRFITPWAGTELGMWIRKQAEDTVDVAAIGWGSSRYLDLARTRAKCWTKCSKAYPHYALGLRYPVEADDDISDASLPLGRVSFRLQSRTTKSELQIFWHIDLDWIGDTESRISAVATFPPTWIERDKQRGSLSKLPETFQMLIRKIGVFEAISVLVRLVLNPE